MYYPSRLEFYWNRMLANAYNTIYKDSISLIFYGNRSYIIAMKKSDDYKRLMTPSDSPAMLYTCYDQGIHHNQR